MHDHSSMDHNEIEATAKDYLIFVAILLGILGLSLAYEYIDGNFDGVSFARAFMGTFFLVFALFKLADLRGFVMSYIGYDIIARKFTAYAYIYPFIELLLAAGYFFNIPGIDYITLVVMTIGAIGVARQLLRGSRIKCACLGTYVKLPLTTVSLVEDLGMGLMALALLIYKV